MSTITSYAVQIRKKVGAILNNIYPQNRAVDVLIDSDNESLPTGTTNLSHVIDNLGDLAFEDSISIPDATTSVAGVVQLSASTNDTTTATTAATTSAVGTVNANAVHVSGDETINGIKTFTGPVVVNNNIRISSNYDSVLDQTTVTFEYLAPVEEEEEVTYVTCTSEDEGALLVVADDASEFNDEIQVRISDVTDSIPEVQIGDYVKISTGEEEGEPSGEGGGAN